MEIQVGIWKDKSQGKLFNKASAQSNALQADNLPLPPQKL
jgi:hypothetical protein